MLSSKSVQILLVLLFPIMSWAEVIQLDADYILPTASEEERSFNTFKLENYQVEVFPNGEAVMQFDLPKNMVGQEGQRYQLKLTGKITDQIKALSGSNAKAVCEGPWRNMKCSLTFTKVKLNKSELLKTLHKEHSEIEAQNRFNMLLRFSTDPIGLALVRQL